MVRKAPATTKHKGSQKNETYMAGTTDSADFIQQTGDSAGIELDDAIAREARETSANELMEVPEGGLNSEIAAPVNPASVVPAKRS